MSSPQEAIDVSLLTPEQIQEIIDNIEEGGQVPTIGSAPMDVTPLDFIGTVVKNLLTEIIQHAVWFLEAIQYMLRMFKHGFKHWMSVATQTATGTLIVLGVIIATTILGFHIAGTEAWIALKARWELSQTELKMWTGNILSWLRYREVFAVHRITLLLSPEYNKMWESFYQAFGSLSEDLFNTIGPVASLMRETRILFMMAYSMLGKSPDWIEGFHTTQVALFMDNVNKNFSRYAENPQLIFTDIDRDIVAPAMEAQNKVIAMWFQQLSDLEEGIADNLEALEAFRDQYDKVIAELPEEMSANFDKHFGPWLDSYDKFMDETIMPNFEKIDGVFEIVREEIAINEEALARQQKDSLFIADQLYKLQEFDPNEFTVQFNMLSYMMLEPGNRYKLIKSSLMTVNYERQVELAEKVLERNRYEKPPAVFKAPVILRFTPKDFAGKTWFVGEY